MAKIDLNKLKDEISSRKQGGNTGPSHLGENAGGGVVPRYEFLNGLITSLNTGKETPASTLIKVVENKVAVKAGEGQRYAVNETAPRREAPRTAAPNNYNPDAVDMSPERDEQLFRDLENKRKKTLAESIQGFTQPTGSQQPNYGQQPMQPMMPMQPMQAGVPMINEAYLAESVKNTVNNYLIENFGPVLEEAIKSTIIEMYAVERIKDVMNENHEIIENIVYKTIKKLQDKAKAAKAQQ
jgi:hypothetical protein